MRILRRLWVDGKDITSIDAVAEEAAEEGIDADALRAAVQTDRVKALLRDAVDDAVGKNVFGSPFFVVDDQPVWGVDRLWMLEHWLTHGSWEPHPG